MDLNELYTIFCHILEHGIIIQLNAEAFLRFATKRSALALVSAGAVGFLGSDCHNMDDRKPNLSDAAEVICRYAGVGCVKRIMDGSAALLENAEAIF